MLKFPLPYSVASMSYDAISSSTKASTISLIYGIIQEVSEMKDHSPTKSIILISRKQQTVYQATRQLNFNFKEFYQSIDPDKKNGKDVTIYFIELWISQTGFI